MRAARRFLARPLSGLAIVLALSACDPATTGDMFKTPAQKAAEQQAAAQAAAAKRKAEEEARLAVFRKPVPLPLDANGEPIIEVAGGGAPAVGPGVFGPAPATVAPVLGGDVPTALTLSGTGWTAQIDGKTMLIKAPGSDKARSIEVRRTGYLGGSDYTGSLGEGKGLRLNVARKVCNDGSGLAKAYTAKLVIGEQAYTGCATSAK